ncbi:MAG: IS110 family transposase, partial [Gammaproteobacteria bacterium]
MAVRLSGAGKTAQAFSQVNGPAGIRSLIKQLKTLQPRPRLIVLEPSGGYEQAVANALRDAQLTFALVNARKARRFAQAGDYLAKTDRVDAAMLAHFAEAMQPTACLMPDENAQKLAALRTRRQQLVEMLTAEKNRAHLAHPAAQPSLKATIKSLRTQLCHVEQLLQDMIRADPVWLERQRLLVSFKGVSTITAFALLACLPELGQVSTQTISALVGVAPLNNDSGEVKGERQRQRHIFGGRTHVRSALYMATLAATRHNPVIRQFYHRLLHAGKRKKVALTACCTPASARKSLSPP